MTALCSRFGRFTATFFFSQGIFEPVVCQKVFCNKTDHYCKVRYGRRVGVGSVDECERSGPEKDVKSRF